MTDAYEETVMVIEHRFVVPCEEPWGGNWKDFGMANHWAKTKADELGIDATTDDWSRLQVEDDRLVIVLTERVHLVKTTKETT